MDLRQLRGSFRVTVWQMLAPNAQNGIREMRVTCTVCWPPCRRWISTRWRARTCPSPRPSACRSRGTTTSTRWSPTSTSSSPSVTRRPASPRVRASRGHHAFPRRLRRVTGRKRLSDACSLSHKLSGSLSTALNAARWKVDIGYLCCGCSQPPYWRIFSMPGNLAACRGGDNCTITGTMLSPLERKQEWRGTGGLSASSWCSSHTLKHWLCPKWPLLTI